MQAEAVSHPSPQVPQLGIAAPLISLVIYTIGHGLLTTLLTVRLNNEGVSELVIGLVSSSYFAGLMIGTLVNTRLIMRVGHIRAYAAYASILSAISLLFGLVVIPEVWIVSRLIGGFATGGLLVVIESWMLASSTASNRGRIMAIYMVLFYAAIVSGQLLLTRLSPGELTAFAVAAMAASLSVVPLALSRVAMPQLDTSAKFNILSVLRKTPAATVSSASAGLILGVIYGILPLFFSQQGYDLDTTAKFMAATVSGGMILQYPLGRLSDHFDRRKVLISLFSATVLLSFTYLYIGENSGFLLTCTLLFLLGGMVFSIYPISLGHACDELSHEEMISANQGLLLSYSIGAMAGPIIASVFISSVGAMGMFAYFASLSIFVVLFLLLRLFIRDAIPLEEHIAYASTTPNTPLMAELDPRGDHDDDVDSR